MDREQKTAVVKELAEELQDAEAIFAVDYRGISVPQAAELRTGLRDADARFRVVKNRLTLRAADQAGTESLKEHLEGPTALAFVKGDAAQAAKTLFRLGSEWELLTYKGGLMDGEDLDEDTFKAIARLPGRDQLNAQFAGVVASPLTGLVRGLGSMIQGLALQLGQIAEQGLVTGEPPAETPAEETPAEEEEASKDEEGASKQEEEAPKEVEAPAGEADSEGSDEEPAEAEEASSEEAEDASSDGEAAEPAAESSDPDPEPEQSPEETSEEQAPEGEDAGQGDPSETGEGDQDIAEEPATEDSKDASSDEASEDSDDEKEEGS